MVTRSIFHNGVAVVGLAALALAALPQQAAAATDGLPDGSWRQSCERGYVSNGTLHARCRHDGGYYQETSAPIASCGAFGNRNGTLFCESPGVGVAGIRSWSGSFRDSCKNVVYDKHGKLQATCRKDNGTFKRSNLQARDCPSYRAGNRNGNLFCESGGGGSGQVSQWQGSFGGSCRDASVNSNGVLTATCQAANGGWRRTSLSPNQCGSYRAGNRDGNLFCESGDSGASVSRWDGSFSKSCRDASVNSNGVLTANCQTANGNWRRTSLSPNQCGSYRAGNRDGNLFCESGDSGASASRWEGSFGGSCRDASVNSNGVLTATCQAANGGWRRTSLSPNQCGSYRAGNRDGNLFCESDDSDASASRWDGSFSKSCRDASVNSNGVLTANCQTMSGNWNRSSLSPSQCGSYRAGNRDGNLFCESGDSGASASRWEGSFGGSCRDASVNSNGVLTATCQAANGGWRRTSLSPNQCGSYRAGNRDGNLFCESDDSDASASRWDGSFSKSCRDASVNSNGVLTANCQTANGNWNRSSLSPSQCGSYRAGNRDGNLFCESGDSGASASRWEGSFGGSCRDASVNSNGVLTATCQAANGGWRRTSLSPNQCGSYRAGNRDGNLFCESGDSDASVSRWDGSFGKSCRDASVNSNGVLTATCQTMSGNWNRSSLSPSQCGSYRAGNRDGTLFCE